ncbi:hypothetical protein Q7P37_005294 [Cladosporium fusiforme]
MADMLAGAQSSDLFQRRMSRLQYDSLDMASLMASFNMPFQSEELAASGAMPNQNAIAQQPLPNLAPTMAPGDLFNMNTNLENITQFNNPYNMASGQTNNTEDVSPVHPSQLLYDSTAYASPPDYSSPFDSSDESKPAVFSTDIDTLMRAIQSKRQDTESDQQAQSSSPSTSSSSGAASPRRNKAKRRYQCAIPGCEKAFHQKTHLDIHTRAHTGVKPFLCKEPSCGQRFSQLGNLKTHERRHTGERPYHCDICGKTFAQHGNVRAHQIVHTAAKPFTCRLDECGKHFTQLGNLKSHQNKFHSATIRRLKERFENIKEGDVVEEWEKELWEYFVNLYKNCNKGIKGRGKDRKISNTSSVAPPSLYDGMPARRDSLMSNNCTSPTSRRSSLSTNTFPHGQVSAVQSSVV